LRLMSRSPVTIAGAHFAARERVRVKFGGLLRFVHATAAGTFVVRFNATSDPCLGTLLISALGATGDSARIREFARACPPSPSSSG
jgi:hypothetical protein